MGSRSRDDRIGLNHPIHLGKANADQGRLGGLLKLWLVERAGQGAPAGEVRHLHEQNREMQGRLAEIVDWV
jgi:hypothetical protein